MRKVFVAKAQTPKHPSTPRLLYKKNITCQLPAAASLCVEPWLVRKLASKG